MLNGLCLTYKKLSNFTFNLLAACVGSREFLDAPRQLPPAAPHGQLHDPGVRAVRASGGALLGVVLAQPGGHLRQNITR